MSDLKNKSRAEPGVGNETIQVVYDGLTVQLIPAPFVKRFLAYACDLAVITASMYVLGLAFIVVAFGGLGLGAAFSKLAHVDWATITGGIIAIVVLITFVLVMGLIYHGYFVFYEYKKSATPGKRIFGLKVIAIGRPRLTFGQCVLRDLLRYIDCMMIFPGLICMTLTKRRQRLGDLAASTLVVHSAEGEKKNDFLYLNQNDYCYLKEILKPTPVTDEIRNRYLAFAYPEFILKSRFSGEDVHRQWKEYILPLVPGAATETFDQKTILLFFAEHCFQQGRSN